MSDGDYLLQAIIANPEDDLPRLAFADFCDENGQSERAEFIRLGFELVAIGECQHPGSYGEFHRCGECAFCKAMERQMELLNRNRLCRPGLDCEHSWSIASPPSVSDHFPSPVPGPHLYFRKGFPEVVHCPLDVWLKVGSQIVAACPIRKVVASDKRPRPGFQCFVWDVSMTILKRSSLPPRIHGFLKGKPIRGGVYPTEQAALDALSDVLLRVAHDPGLLNPINRRIVSELPERAMMRATP